MSHNDWTSWAADSCVLRCVCAYHFKSLIINCSLDIWGIHKDAYIFSFCINILVMKNLVLNWFHLFFFIDNIVWSCFDSYFTHACYRALNWLSLSIPPTIAMIWYKLLRERAEIMVLSVTSFSLVNLWLVSSFVPPSRQEAGGRGGIGLLKLICLFSKNTQNLQYRAKSPWTRLGVWKWEKQEAQSFDVDSLSLKLHNAVLNLVEDVFTDCSYFESVAFLMCLCLQGCLPYFILLQWLLVADLLFSVPITSLVYLVHVFSSVRCHVMCVLCLFHKCLQHCCFVPYILCPLWTFVVLHIQFVPLLSFFLFCRVECSNAKTKLLEHSK